MADKNKREILNEWQTAAIGGPLKWCMQKRYNKNDEKSSTFPK